ncbi:anti-sigma factor family protein [Tateyamaria omphalii]|uniref:Zinc-finger domain-containing protein n=1 Tax=Tateyamaria omphalii TaxID=299262 RepID=A0A1P8MRW7_9RHOB|nr:hypothetical protein [Tateyamaria omphalii]APX10709.1 hypothetical protein BWR18_02635 [Tateyamaria omphalii]
MDRPDGLSEDTLLAHLRGETDPETAARIEAQAEADPALRAELALMAGLRGALAQGEGAAQGGWDRLAAEIDRTKPANLPHRPVWRIAALFLGAVVLVQGAFLVVGDGSGDGPLYRTVTEAPAEATLAVAFEAETTAAEIEALLRETGASIMDGPSALGLYRLVFVDAAAREAAQTALETSPLVEIVAEE